VRLAGAETENKSISINTDKVNFPQFLKDKLVAIHPFTSDPIKQWPLERFKELAMRIEKELNLNVIIIGLSLTEFVPDGNAIDMTNKTSLPELAALLKRCVLLISGDSGPVHLAAAVGVPVIALFRSDIPGKCALRWGPWGEGHSVIEKINLRDIRVDEVIGLIREKYVLGK
jgi:ADP-heptose:LPS heptosyltransferase